MRWPRWRPSGNERVTGHPAAQQFKRLGIGARAAWTKCGYGNQGPVQIGTAPCAGQPCRKIFSLNASYGRSLSFRGCPNPHVGAWFGERFPEAQPQLRNGISSQSSNRFTSPISAFGCPRGNLEVLPFLGDDDARFSSRRQQ